jgi:hypothetical protein
MEVIDYIRSILKSMTRSTYLEVCIYNAHLYTIADRTVFYYIDLSSKLDPNIIFAYHNLMDDFNAIVEDQYVLHRVLDKYRELKGIELYNNKIFENDNLREDQKFEDCINVNATDGASFYFMNANNNTSPFIPVFSGLPILNKNDKLKIELYDCNNHNVLVRMIIFKKKLNIPYDLYYKILDVNRPIRDMKGEYVQ